MYGNDYDDEYEPISGSAIVIGYVAAAISGAGMALLFIQILNWIR